MFFVGRHHHRTRMSAGPTILVPCAWPSYSDAYSATFNIDLPAHGALPPLVARPLPLVPPHTRPSVSPALDGRCRTRPRMRYNINPRAYVLYLCLLSSACHPLRARLLQPRPHVVYPLLPLRCSRYLQQLSRRRPYSPVTLPSRPFISSHRLRPRTRMCVPSATLPPPLPRTSAATSLARPGLHGHLPPRPRHLYPHHLPLTPVPAVLSTIVALRAPVVLQLSTLLAPACPQYSRALSTSPSTPSAQTVAQQRPHRLSSAPSPVRIYTSSRPSPRLPALQHVQAALLATRPFPLASKSPLAPTAICQDATVLSMSSRPAHVLVTYRMCFE